MSEKNDRPVKINSTTHVTGWWDKTRRNNPTFWGVHFRECSILFVFFKCEQVQLTQMLTDIVVEWKIIYGFWGLSIIERISLMIFYFYYQQIPVKDQNRQWTNIVSKPDISSSSVPQSSIDGQRRLKTQLWASLLGDMFLHHHEHTHCS